MSKRRRQPRRTRPASAPRPATPPHADVAAAHEDAPSRIAGSPALWIGVGLVALVAVVFSPLRHAGFIRLDDAGYVSQNPDVTAGLTWHGLVWAFTTGRGANWHPLTWLSHMLDVQVFGLRPGAHHLVNVAFHAVNALLLFTLLRRATGALYRSAIVAALFAVHPLHVESVAWIAERKDVLSTALWLATMIAYVAWVRAPRRDRYLAVCAGLALGLMAKPMLVTLPFALLLFDIWPLGRTAPGPNRRSWRALVLEKLPFVLLAAASSVVTFFVQRSGGAVQQLTALPLSIRTENAIVAYVRYLVETVWPSGLTIFYPYPHAVPAWQVAGSLAALAVLSGLAWASLQRRPYVFVGWCWYLGTLVPVIGLVQVGMQSSADRYTYVPLIGIFIAVVWGVADLASRLAIRRTVLAAATALVVAASAVTAHAQASHWLSDWTVWSHALAVTRDNYIADNAMGVLLVQQGRHDEADADFQEAAHLQPGYAQAHNNLGLAYQRVGKHAEALAEFRLAVQLQPDLPEAQDDLGFALMGEGQTDEAMVHYREAVRLDPGFATAHVNLGFLLATRKQMAEAIDQFREAVRLDPDSESGHMYLGMALAAVGQPEAAAREFRDVQRINPANTSVQSAIDSLSPSRPAPGRGRGGGGG